MPRMEKHYGGIMMLPSASPLASQPMVNGYMEKQCRIPLWHMQLAGKSNQQHGKCIVGSVMNMFPPCSWKKTGLFFLEQGTGSCMPLIPPAGKLSGQIR